MSSDSIGKLVRQTLRNGKRTYSIELRDDLGNACVTAYLSMRGGRAKWRLSICAWVGGRCAFGWDRDVTRGEVRILIDAARGNGQ